MFSKFTWGWSKDFKTCSVGQLTTILETARRRIYRLGFVILTVPLLNIHHEFNCVYKQISKIPLKLSTVRGSLVTDKDKRILSFIKKKRVFKLREHSKT